MKRKISSTLAVTLIATQMQTVSVTSATKEVQDVQNSEISIVNEENIKENANQTEANIDTNISEDNTQSESKTEENSGENKVDKEGNEVDKEGNEVDDKNEPEAEIEEDNNQTEAYEAKGKLELDLNFSLPIKYTTSDLTNIKVTLKKDNNEIGSINLGSDTTNGSIDSDVVYTVEALNSKRAKLGDEETEVVFYHLLLDNISIGNYSLEISGDGYETAVIENIDITKTSKRVLVGTSDNTVVVDDKEENYPGVFLVGNIDQSKDGMVTVGDYNLLKDKIKAKEVESKFDLNRDNKVDITDLSYIHKNIGKEKKEANILDTDIIINPEDIVVDFNKDKLQVTGNINNIFKSDDSVVSIQDKEGNEISEENPVSIPIDLGDKNNPSKVEQIVIKAPAGTAPTSGTITIPGAGENGDSLVVNFDNTATFTRSSTDEIVVNLGKQVAVSEVTINVTGSRGNKNLVEIAKVEFVNNVYKEIPKPKMNVPVINKYTSATAVGNEHIVLGWNHEANVTGYELKLEKLNDKGEVDSTSTYRTNENSIKIEKINGYDTYRVSIQSLSGDDWKSGYKDEQEGYDKEAEGNTNLSNNKNDKDGIPDNVDSDYNEQGWKSTTGELATNNVMYGADSIVELQVIPETRPEGPEGISISGLYKGLGVSWKAHKKSKDYDVYYRKVGDGAWVKANDPNDPKYVDSNTTNDIPDGVTNLSPEEKLDRNELIRGTSTQIYGLEDGATYEIKMTATNHLGTGDLSKTYLGTTQSLKPATMIKYGAINIPKSNSVEGESPVEGIIDVQYSGNYILEGDKFAITDNNPETHWTGTRWNQDGSPSPVVIFDKEYEMDTIRLTTRYDGRYGNTQDFYQTSVTYYDSEQEKDVKINVNARRIRDNNGVWYYELKLPHKITTNKIQVGLQVYPQYVDSASISEIIFYNYDSLKDDVANLFKDDLMLELSKETTQERIDELTARAKTMDARTMEYHPDQEQLLSDLQRAQELLDDVNLNDNIKTLDSGIRNQGNTIGQSNNYQSLGVAVKPGDKINIYIGSNRKDTKFNLAITQHYAESGTAVQTYNTQLSVGKNEITIPESKFNMDCEKGGNLYLSFASNYDEVQDVKVRVSGGTQIPHLNVNNLIDDSSKEDEVKTLIRNYLRELSSYVRTLPSRYPSEEDKINNIYTYDKETSILNTTEIEGERIALTLPADQVLSGIQQGLTTEEEQVERVYNTLLAWEQIMKVSYAQQGLIENPIDFDNDGKITNTPLAELDGKSENEYFNANRAPRNRINIKYQRMFTGAFMYASSHHVGIGYESAAGMLQGVPFKFDENGNLVNSKDGQLFGWGIGHEIGHVHDAQGLTYAEITNNVLALITQTFNDENLSRLESEERYKSAYERVTSGSVGIPDNGIALIMFWQLHLAYDNGYTYDMVKDNNDGDLNNDTFYAKLYRTTRQKGIAESEAGYDQTAQTYIMRSSDVVQKDLRPFFESWGLVASPKTNEYLDSMNYPVETKTIQYLNDEARRLRLEAINNHDMSSVTMSKDTAVTGAFGQDKNGNSIGERSYLNQKEVPLRLSVNKEQDKILGYEIIRKEVTAKGYREVPVGFVERDKDNNITEYTDVIDNVNNRTFTYKVKAYDYDLNCTEEFEIGTIKVSHDGSIAKNSWTFDTNTMSTEDVVNEESGHGHNENGTINNIKDNDTSTVYKGIKATDSNGNILSGDPYVTINLGTSKQVVGLKYTPAKAEAKKFSLRNLFKRNTETTYKPISKYEVLASEDGKTWAKVHSGTFDSTKENIIYFNEAGNSDNNQLWATNAQYVKLVAKDTDTISIAELDVLGQPGDNIEIGMDNSDQEYKNGIGRLKASYEYAPGKVIPEGSIVVMGEYKGDPAFNIPLVLNENNENFALKSQVVLLANLPENSELGEVAEGNWIYWITPEQEKEMIDGESNIEGKAIKAELYRYNKLDSNNAPVGQRLVSDTFLFELPSNLEQLPLIDLTNGQSKYRKSSYDSVVEIDSDTLRKTAENRR